MLGISAFISDYVLGPGNYVIGFVLLLGVLVTIHEFGHFIVAKWCGMRVETFAVGFGKKLLTWTRGETEYALCLFPLGGYVKITGQDPRDEVDADLEHRTFRAKPLWMRASVVLAGPLFNAALALILFIGLVAVGLPSQAPVFEKIRENSPAYKAGFRSGDWIKSVSIPNAGKHSIREFRELELLISENANKNLTFEVLRDDNLQAIQYTPKLGLDRDSVLMVTVNRGTVDGWEKLAPSSTLIIDNPNSWLGLNKLPNGFTPEEVTFNSQTFEVKTFDDVTSLWATIAAQAKLSSSSKHELSFTGKIYPIPFTGNPKQTLQKIAKQDPETFTIEWSEQSNPIPSSLNAAGAFSTDLVVGAVMKDLSAEKIGIKSGDRLTHIEDRPMSSAPQFIGAVQKFANASSDNKIKISWSRKGEAMSAVAEPKWIEVKDPFTEAPLKKFLIGIQFSPAVAPPTQAIVRATGVGDAIALGWTKTYNLTATILKSFYHLFSGNISAKHLGGPLSIVQIAGKSFSQGATSFLRMMAFISLNLFILNLLPLPVLDGGHLVLFCLEAIRRKPLNAKIVEVWTTVGFVLLLGLMVMATVNDISRYVKILFSS